MSWVVELFRVLSSCGSTIMILSLVPMVYEIHKARATGHYTIMPLATMLVNCHLWMLYGFLDRNWVPLFLCFSFGDVISIAYLAVYYRYTRDRAYAHKVFAVCAAVIAVTTAYAVLGELGLIGQSQSAVTATMGYVGIAATFLLYGSPFEKMALVVKTRCGVFIPIVMVTVGVGNCGVWVVYSLLTQDWFLFGSNVFTLSMGLVQVALYLTFHPRSHALPAEYQLDNDGAAGKDLERAMPLPGTNTYASLESPHNLPQ